MRVHVLALARGTLTLLFKHTTVWKKNWQAPDVIQSVLRLVGPASVYTV